MYRKKNKGWMKHFDFTVVDLLWVELSFYFAFFIRHLNKIPYSINFYLKTSMVLAAADLVVVLLMDSYKNVVKRNWRQEIWSTFEHVTLTELFVILYEFIVQDSLEFSRLVFLMSWGIAFITCYANRLIYKKIVIHFLTSKSNIAQMLVITTTKNIESCFNQLQKYPIQKFNVCAVNIFEESPVEKKDDFNGISLNYGKDELIEYIRQQVVDEIFIDSSVSSLISSDDINKFLAMGITVRMALNQISPDYPNEIVEKIGGEYVLTSAIKTASSWRFVIKRLIDILGGLVGLVFTFIIMIFIGPIIAIQSPGPIFFKQVRIGKNGRKFNMYKFRSMYLDAEERLKDLESQNEMKGLMFKMENDPRIIGSEKGPGRGIGNFIRKTSLDEFPQFLNVLKGDMSLVGTRPPTLSEYEKYELHHKVRLSMKPGITGLWQVSGRSDINDFEEVVNLDTEYIKHWSLFFDFKILCKTFGVVFRRKGSK